MYFFVMSSVPCYSFIIKLFIRFCRLDQNIIIDATKRGGLGRYEDLVLLSIFTLNFIVLINILLTSFHTVRFINHSCDSNVYSQVVNMGYKYVPGSTISLTASDEISTDGNNESYPLDIAGDRSSLEYKEADKHIIMSASRAIKVCMNALV